MFQHNTAVIWANGEVEGFSNFSLSSKHDAEEKCHREIIEKANFNIQNGTADGYVPGKPAYKLLTAKTYKTLSPALKKQIQDDWKMAQQAGHRHDVYRGGGMTAESLLKMVEGLPDFSDRVTIDIPVELAYKLKSKDTLPEPGFSRFDHLETAIKAGNKIDPIEIGWRNNSVYPEPEIDDGHHRLAVAMHLGHKTIKASMGRGTAKRLGLLK